MYIYEKIEILEDLYEEWKRKTSDKKDVKDAIIQRRHLIKMDLDYWRKKLDTFTVSEYKSGWRNSQLRDTQVITKYALPYLKTVFNKVEAQKGQITTDFRKIFKLQPRPGKKDRTQHSHHAVDAAVLTLIPSAAIREKILKAYNEQQDKHTGNVYHEKPVSWKHFRSDHILSISDDLAINFQASHRTLKQSKKSVRKRGKQQFVKFKDQDGRWHFQLNAEGDKIPLVAKGKTIRGQLHKESFYGAVKKGKELLLVERYPISDFASINDCKHIVDDAVRNIVREALQQRMNDGLSFDKAKLDPIPFPNGKAVIRKVRCKVAAGRGYLTLEKAIPVQTHSFLSAKKYKQHYYAQNDENTLCLYYEQRDKINTNRAFRIVGLFELAQLGLTHINEIKNRQGYNIMESIRGNDRKAIPLACVLRTGQKLLLYNEDKEELKNLDLVSLVRRLFVIYKFNDVGSTKYIYLQIHNEARPDKDLGDGDTTPDSKKSQSRLKLTADKFNFAIESRDFVLSIDGSIKWLF